VLNAWEYYVYNQIFDYFMKYLNLLSPTTLLFSMNSFNVIIIVMVLWCNFYQDRFDSPLQ